MKGVLYAFLIVTGYTQITSGNVIETIVTTVFSNCTDIKNFLGVSYAQMNSSQPSENDMNLLFFNGTFENQQWRNIHDVGNSLIGTSIFDTSLPTEIIIQGFLQNYASEDTNVLAKAFLAKGNRNIILLESANIIGFWYMYSSTAIQFIGQRLGDELAKLVTKGYDKSKIHLIGFDMGAHIAGFAAKRFRNITGGSLPWITGLDPAGPCFFNNDAEERLDASDADFVDVIHTNMGVWGTDKQIGDVDFYPNGGNNQPGATLPKQSHLFAIYLYAESITNPYTFAAAKCKCWLLFQMGGCSWNGRVYMGYDAAKTAAGRYYFPTNAASLYGLAEAGIPAFNFFSWLAGLFF